MVSAPSESNRSPIPRPADSAARHLHPSSAAEGDSVVLDSDILTEIATGLAAAIEHVDPAAPHSIQRIPLLATAGYDAWLMVWGPGAALESHDHDGSIGVVHVVEGELLETSGGLDRQLTPLRRLGAGECTDFAAADQHALFNPGDGTVVSVGVYSPPLGAGN